MSVRAYKLIEIKTEDEPSFNLSHDERIREIGVYNDEGTFSIQKEDAQELFDKIAEELGGEDSDEGNYLADCLAKIIKDCGDEDFAEYYCY